MDLNKHIVKNDNNKLFHSSGFAQVANGNNVGSTAKISFNQRQQIESNRRLVYGYNRSAIGNTYSALRAKPVSNDSSRPVSGLSSQQYNSQIRSPRFSEPLARRYNPYA